MAHGQITYIEFPADDTARASRFYSELFGWKLTEWPEFPGYFVFSTGPTVSAGGAIGERGKSVGDRVRVYIEVDSIGDLVGRAPALGGKVITPRTEIVGQGWYGVILDSEGSELGLYEGRASA